MKAGIVGVGKVGGATAFALAREGDWDELVLVDTVEDLAWSQAEDIRHGLRISTQPVVRAGSLDDLSESDVVVLCVGQGRKPGMTRLDLLHANAGLVAQLSREIARAASTATLVVLTNPMDVMTTIAWRSTGWPRTRVLGSGTLLDSLRLRMILADRLKVPSVKVSATAIGEHGQRIVPVFSRARVAGRRLTLSAQEMEEITQQLRDVSGRIVQAKGGTEFGPGGTTADLIAALVGPRPRVVPCSVVLEGEYGVRDVAIGVPAILGTRRVLALEEWPLSDDERAAFDEAARDLKASADDTSVLLQLVPKPLP
jgi:malate/lactate dehydrogenase